MLFYYHLLDSTIRDMSSLFGIVNSIRPFCILCIYTFCYVLYSSILTWRFSGAPRARQARGWAEPHSLVNLPIPENLVIT